MRRSRILLAGLVLLSAAMPALTQITITQGSFAAIGSSVNQYSSAGPVAVTIGPSGANQTWTIPEYTVNEAVAVTMVTPASTPYAAYFPTSTHCYAVSVGGGLSYSYLQVSASEIRSAGFASSFGIELIGVYDPKGLVSPLPLSYPHASWTSVSQYFIEIFPGFGTTFRDSTIRTLDGWGTVQTQFGNYQVLRTFQHTWATNTVTGQPPQVTESVGYAWVNAQGIGIVSMSTQGSDPNFTNASVTFQIPGQVSADPVRGPVARSFDVQQNFPNPFNPETTLPLSVDHTQQVSLKIYDETGRLVSEENYTLPAGQHTLRVDGSSWGTGTYFANVSSENESQTLKMQLIK